MIEAVTLRSPDEVSAALNSTALNPPPPPPTLGTGSTAVLRGAMARFAHGQAHLERRLAVVELITSLDRSTITSLATLRASRRLQGAPVCAVAEIAYTVPTEVLLDALSVADDVPELAHDVRRLATVIGRGAPSDQASDDAVDRLSARFADHSAGPVAVLSMLYQNHDATAALLIETLDAAANDWPRRPAVDRTVRVARQQIRIVETDVAEGAIVTLHLADSGLEYGLGAHRCPGRELAESIITGIQAAIAANGYRVSTDTIERGQTGRPTVLMLEVRS